MRNFIKDSSSDEESEIENDLTFYYRIDNQLRNLEINKNK